MKPTPSSKEAEKSVLGAILQDNSVMEDIVGWLPTPLAFYYQENQKVWQAMLELREERVPIDVVTVVEKCKLKYPGDNMGYLITGLIDEIPSLANIKYHAKIVWERYIQREVSKSASELKEASFDNYRKVEDLLRKHTFIINELQSLQPSRERSIKLIVNETMEYIKTGNNIVPFGMKALDMPAGGMTRKEITIIGGRPGHGKTSLVVNIAKRLVEQGFKVMMFNREMSNVEMMKKIFVLEAGKITYTAIRKNMFTPEQKKELEMLQEKIKEKYTDRLMMFDDIRDVDGSIREIRRIRPDVVIDDYIQLVRIRGKKEARRFEIEHLLHEYKWIAKDKNCSVLLVSQLSRDIEKRLDPRPRMSDYSEAGTIEQVCENALFVFYGYSFDNEKYDKYESEIIASKVRYGNAGKYSIGFDGNRCKFYSSRDEAFKNRL